MKRRVVAITGGIGSGKSEVTKILNKLGYATVSCDELARTVAAFPQVVDRVRDLLGSGFVENGQLNRKAIREKVFADESLLSQYNEIFFCEVKRLLVDELRLRKGCVFVEIPVFEAFEFDWDAVWLVKAEDDKRIDRAANRDGVSRQSLENILSRQKPCVAYTRKILNNGSLADLEAEVNKALQDI